MKKTAATIAATLLLSMGALVSPASAEEAVAEAPTCEMSTQKWLARSIALEFDLAEARNIAATNATASATQQARLIESEAQRLELSQKVEQQAAKIATQRDKIRDLRRKLRQAR